MSDTLLKDIRAAILADATLAPLVIKRVYPDRAPQTAAVPYIVYNEISLGTEQILTGTNGDRRQRIQFDLYETTKTKALAIREALLALFDGYQGSLTAGAVAITHTELSNQRSGYDIADKLYSYGLDFTFNYRVTTA